MSKNPLPQNLLITKADICICLGYKSMKPIYTRILTEEIVKQLGFNSMKEFKRTKSFTFEQSNKWKDFLSDLTRNYIGNKYYEKNQK